MVVFLVVRGRTDKIFQGAFLVFFITVFAVDGLIVYLGSEGKNPSATESAYNELCCAADPSPWLRFETWIWAVFMLVQVTTVVFLVFHGRRDKTFRQAFYIFFVAVTVVDCVLVLWRPPSLEFESERTLFGTYYDTFLYVEDPTRPKVNAYKAPITSLNDVTLCFIIPVFVHAQPLFLTAIAVNRLTAICFPPEHAAIWSPRMVSMVVFALAMTAVLLGPGVFLASNILRHAVVCSEATAKTGFDYDCETFWVFHATALPNVTVVSLSALCCIICFALNIASIAVMIILRWTGKLRQKVPEIRLFIHSLFMFLLQMLVAFQDVVHIMDKFGDALNQFGINPFAWDLPHSTEWLAGVKGTRMEIPGYGTYFTDGCTVERPSKEQPPCSAWYRILIGELHLRENPYPARAFTVRSLLQTLLAISGSAFLLVISGHVRNAYFKFYFGCLQRKLTQRSSVDVIQVAPARHAIVSSVSGTFSSP